MMALPWDPTVYTFWYVLLIFCMTVIERWFPWRQQALLRAGFKFDVFLVCFNGLVVGLLLGALATWSANAWQAVGLPMWSPPVLIRLPPWAQLVVVLVAKDFLEWLVHRLLHRVPWLWEYHKVHHSITTMDWLGNMRFHWMEVVIYHALLWVPLSLILVEWQVALVLAVVSTLVGHLNHANLRLDWGPLRYVFNSPRFHVWHHDAATTAPFGTNFAIIFTCWDWWFGSAHFPRMATMPERLGYAGQEHDPRSPWRRWCSVMPFLRVNTKKNRFVSSDY